MIFDRIIIGSGWSALGSVGFSCLKNLNVCWISGTGSRVVPPLYGLESGAGILNWNILAEKLGIDLGAFEEGIFIREFRNKSFREPLWSKSLTLESQAEAKNEYLWGPETQFTGERDGRFDLPLVEIEEMIRSQLNEKKFPLLKKIQGFPVISISKSSDQNVTNEEKIIQVTLGSGEKILGQEVIYADKWNILPQILSSYDHLPKPFPLFKKRSFMGMLQATFSHEKSLGLNVKESFYTALHRESGKGMVQEENRHVWGYFSSDGMKSYWSVCLGPEEIEDNHQITKRLKRAKSALNKIFSGTEFIPPGKENFMANVIDEQIRLEEDCINSDEEHVLNSLSLNSVKNVSFLTDGYGPSKSFQQIDQI